MTEPNPHELVVPPAVGWIVHEITPTRSGQDTLWAWCRIQDDGPGYTDIVYTRTDGVTLADPGNRAGQLGPVVFKAFC
jgi:hypothetical protein